MTLELFLMDLEMARWVVATLTVAAFALSIWGAARLWIGARRATTRLERERRARRWTLDELVAAQKEAGENQAELRAAMVKYQEDRAAAGLPEWTYDAVTRGEEPFAERIVEEMASSTRVDVTLVGAGLILGLAASLWGIWL